MAARFVVRIVMCGVHVVVIIELDNLKIHISSNQRKFNPIYLLRLNKKKGAALILYQVMTSS